MSQVAPFTHATQRVVVAGATGAVGRHCIHLLVRDPRVLSVTALIRNEEKSAEFYGLNSQYDDMDKLHHLRIDYRDNIVKQMEGYEFSVGISCLGYNPKMTLAASCGLCGVTRWSYLSGKYIDCQINEFNQLLAAKIKESDIMQDCNKIKSFEFVNGVKPGIILGRPSMSVGMVGLIESTLNYFSFILLNTRYAVHRDDIAKAMVYAVLNETQRGYSVYENEDIKAKAILYDKCLIKV